MGGPGQLFREVKTHKFQKDLVRIKCTGIDTLLNFYKTLRNIASSFNFLLRLL